MEDGINMLKELKKKSFNKEQIKKSLKERLKSKWKYDFIIYGGLGGILHLFMLSQPSFSPPVKDEEIEESPIIITQDEVSEVCGCLTK